MGWVQQKITDRQRLEKSTPALWNSLRDRISDALLEFREFVHLPQIDWKDCTARGRHCIRIEKGKGAMEGESATIEVFLAVVDQTVRVAPDIGDESTVVASYRLNTKGLEFYREEETSSVIMNPDDVAKAVLEPFLFNPFPTAIIRKPSSA